MKSLIDYCNSHGLDFPQAFGHALADKTGRPLTIEQYRQTRREAEMFLAGRPDTKLPDYVEEFLDKERLRQPCLI